MDVQNLLQTQAFDQFPRERLNFVVSRRRFWGALVNTVVAFSGQGDGTPAYGLDALGDLPDEQLAAIVPCILPDCQISVDGGWVNILPPGKKAPTRVVALDSPALTAFNLFNGGNTLADISVDVAEQQCWTPAEAFDYVRGLFLTLVLIGACVPANNQTEG
ncbi:MAG: hypothetical protein KF716_09710 [Anaerolineae bacterium]|nr:hypothetical protein [Anaerolineae bacterium]